MELKELFDAAVTRSNQLNQRPDNEALLELYALYKKATEGDVKGERPGGFDFKAIAKYDAWSSKKGMTPDEAMNAYVALVDTLHRQYG